MHVASDSVDLNRISFDELCKLKEIEHLETLSP